MRALTRSLGAAVALAAALTLSSCSAVGDIIDGDEPKRDDEGTIVEAAEADVFSVLVGDCANYDEVAAGLVETIPTIPCAEAHDSEAFASTDMPAGDFPGDAAINTAAEEFCTAEFATFVGLSYEESTLDFWQLTPSQAGWEQADDRQLLCFVQDLEGGVIGSLKGVAR